MIGLARHCFGLHSVDLSFCDEITDEGIIALSRHCRGLQMVNLDSCAKITDAAVAELADRCPGLRAICLGGCEQITDQAIVLLAKGCRGLQVRAGRGERGGWGGYRRDRSVCVCARLTLKRCTLARCRATDGPARWLHLPDRRGVPRPGRALPWHHLGANGRLRSAHDPRQHRPHARRVDDTTSRGFIRDPRLGFGRSSTPSPRCRRSFRLSEDGRGLNEVRRMIPRGSHAGFRGGESATRRRRAGLQGGGARGGSGARGISRNLEWACRCRLRRCTIIEAAWTKPTAAA